LRSFEIRPHPKAPIFSEDNNPRLIIEQLIGEMSSDNFQATDKVLDLIRQAGFVNLWFYLKFIAGYSGPYDKLNRELHLDMANYRQSDDCMGMGARGAGFISRFHYKSTIWTHGPAGWEALRNPNIRIRVVNAVIDRAQKFVNTTMQTFKSNELFKVLYPEYVIPARQAAFLLPKSVRTKDFPEPTIKAGAAGGASEGDHHDLLCLDDLVGLDDLDVERAGNVNMMYKNHWWDTNVEMLVLDWLTSRVLCFTTLYSIDDPYHKYILSSLKKLKGYPDEEYRSLEREEGEWTVYYRCALEDGKSIFPEAMPKEKIMRLIKEKPWTAMTSIFNKPKKSGIAELAEFETMQGMLVWDSDAEDWVVRVRDKGNFGTGEEWDVYVGDMDVVVGWDPAFTEKGITAKTSKTGIAVWGMDYEEYVYLLWGARGYFGIEAAFDKLFEGLEKFQGYVRVLGVETNAGQKGMPALVKKEGLLRDVMVSVKEVPASGDKTVRIRQGIGSFLMRGKVVLCGGPDVFFLEEQQVFPQDRFNMDFLDASNQALGMLSKPFAPQERLEYEDMEQEVEYNPTVNKTVGY
jgi:hypothetical protein